MGISIEILACKSPHVAIDRKLPFSVTTSKPPRSHRGESSLWQAKFNREGGTLVHIGDPDKNPEKGPFWAYDILEDIEWRRYRFLPKYKNSFFLLLENMLRETQSGMLFLTSDAQLGPKPESFSRTYTLSSVKRIHDTKGLRLNSFVQVISAP
jgi:hypothetical protein